MKCGNAESLLILDGDYEDALNIINMARSVMLAASEFQDAGGLSKIRRS